MYRPGSYSSTRCAVLAAVWNFRNLTVLYLFHDRRRLGMDRESLGGERFRGMIRCPPKLELRREEQRSVFCYMHKIWGWELGLVEARGCDWVVLVQNSSFTSSPSTDWTYRKDICHGSGLLLRSAGWGSTQPNNNFDSLQSQNGWKYDAWRRIGMSLE